MPISSMIRRLLRWDDGATLAEYALLMAFILVVAAVSVRALGISLVPAFTTFAAAL